jgi:hypothetical protein
MSSECPPSRPVPDRCVTTWFVVMIIAPFSYRRAMSWKNRCALRFSNGRYPSSSTMSNFGFA